MRSIFRIFGFIILLFLPTLIFSQSVYTHISNRRICDFLDELAGEKVITLNSAVKPYTRTTIYEKLAEAGSNKDKLNKRQQQELEHYLDYYTFGNVPGYLPSKSKINLFRKSRHLSTSVNHMAFFYSDSLFNFSLRPILGLNYFTNASGGYLHTYGGLEAFGSVTKYLSFYADLRDNTVSEKLAMPTYFTQDMGGIYKGSLREGSADFSEMRGGVMLSWDFLQVGVAKDHIVWGNNTNGAIIQSGRTPSFPMLKLHISPVKWFDFNYFHAWLVSDVVDSSLTYLLPGGINRETFKNKYMASNMFTIMPLRGLSLSFGNSIIYSDQNVNPAYLIPVFFYKSVDHSLTSYKIVNHNSQMFFDMSIRMLRHTHFFLTVFVDEFSTKRISDPDAHNFYAYKLGGKVSNWPVSNLSVTGEYFRSVPATYQHYGPTFTYESNSYNMGPYLRDNSEEIFVAVDFKPVQRLFARYAYTSARHGNDYGYVYGNQVTSLPILKDNTWTSVSHSLLCSYEVFTNCHLTLEYRHSNIQGYDIDGQTAQDYLDMFTPDFFQGVKNTVMVRVNVGF
ncbi:MAG: hypothetical protein JXR41_15370 [Bacteroidales bacterium]|nr:hypothetical protein [Bacteroidales bacterium]